VAIANPGVALSLYHNDNTVFHLKPSNLKQRIVSIYGNAYKQRFVPVEQQTDIVNISGFIGKPEFARKTRGEQFFFANQRFIKHPYLHHSVDNAFQELLPADAFPSYFLFLEVDPKSIDINIHPTKTEINFLNNQVLYSILRSAVKQALGKYSIAPTLDFDKEPGLEIPPLRKNQSVRIPNVQYDPDYNPFSSNDKNTKQEGFAKKEANRQNWEVLYEKGKPGTNDQREEVIHTQTNQFPIEEHKKDELIGSGSQFSQLHRKYILANVKSGMMIIDQHRAHYRILFERYLQILHSRTAGSQQQLFPVTLQLNAEDAELLNGILDDVKLIGFSISNFGKNSFLVEGIPEGLESEKINDLLERILENYKKNNADLDIDKKVNLARSMAKNTAIKAGRILLDDEINSLINELFACKVPGTTPDGLPILRIITINELDEKFSIV